MKLEGAGGQKEGRSGEQEKWQREAGRRSGSCRGGQRDSDASLGALHPDAYLMSSYSASVPMIW